jgi:GH25 family lysozyme M1 (1,4-beta-N-acetylmuramidase)
MATCRGIDVSAYQNPQDWAGRKAEGIVFAFAKASEGQHSRDDMFARHITGIVKAGLVPGAYHFGWPTQDAATEAANYIAAVKPYATAGFLHWLDLERRTDGANYAGRSAAQIKAWATTWIAAVQAAFPGQRVGVYTSSDDLSKDHVPAGVPLWYPAYSWGYTAVPYSNAEAAARPRPSSWSPLFWQFTSTPIDRSICYLSEADLRTWAAGEETDVALTADDISKVAAASAKAVLTLDGVIAAPADDPNVKTNQFWALQSYIKDTNARLRAVQATEAAQSAAIATLATTVAALAANTAAIDPAALVAEIQAAIDNVTIHITTS